jgi:membrane protease YdiL (CAAX protease family)
MQAQPTLEIPPPAVAASSSRGLPAAAQSRAVHSPVASIALHILPGVITLAIYLLLRQPVAAIGYPSLVALNVAILVGLIPTVAAILLYSGYRQNGRVSLQGVLLYREHMRLRIYLVNVLLVFGASLVLITLVGEKFISPLLKTTLFSWMPTVDWGLGGGYSKSVLIASYALVAIASTVCEPIVEELYFRGFLLPRMDFSGRWTVPLHTFLYALFHLWYPWRVVTLAIGMSPLVYAVRRSRNIYVGLIVHLMLDSSYLFLGVVYILAMR